jgi:hypothetical protein
MHANTRKLLRNAAGKGGTVTFLDEPEFDQSSDLPVWDVYVVYDGAADEEFTVRTDQAPVAILSALVADLHREYAADPTAELGFSVEIYPAVRHDGDDPTASFRYEPPVSVDSSHN